MKSYIFLIILLFALHSHQEVQPKKEEDRVRANPTEERCVHHIRRTCLSVFLLNLRRFPCCRLRFCCAVGALVEYLTYCHHHQASFTLEWDLI
ncbi:unnamed protein product [Fasciola hepatica]|uniref:Secreted protein n=1 Tax=Fasciola hepatica TaxID=6192 RepID=A0ABC9HHP3_FASHE